VGQIEAKSRGLGFLMADGQILRTWAKSSTKTYELGPYRNARISDHRYTSGAHLFSKRKTNFTGETKERS
jgi:hypothetical protein